MTGIGPGPGAPDSRLTPYRIPADPDALQTDDPGVFARPVEPAQVTAAEVAAALEDLQVSAAVEHLRRLITVGLRRGVRKVRARGVNVTVLTPGPEDLAAIGANLMGPRRRVRVLDTSLRTSAAALATLEDAREATT